MTPSRAETVLLDEREVTFTCPVGDGYDWYYDAKLKHATRVSYVVASPKYFNKQCGLPWPQKYPDACTTLPRDDPAFGGAYSVIYSMAPVMQEGLLEHELCHTQGWMHGKRY